MLSKNTVFIVGFNAQIFHSSFKQAGTLLHHDDHYRKEMSCPLHYYTLYWLSVCQFMNRAEGRSRRITWRIHIFLTHIKNERMYWCLKWHDRLLNLYKIRKSANVELRIKYCHTNLIVIYASCNNLLGISMQLSYYCNMVIWNNF